MNSNLDPVTEAAIRYRTDRIFDDWAPSRRRTRRRALRRAVSPGGPPDLAPRADLA